MAKTQPRKPLTLSNLKQVFRIFRFLRPYRAPFILASIFLLLGSFAGMVIPFLMGKLIDSASAHPKPGPWHDTTAVGIALAAVLVLQSAVGYFRVSLFAKVTEKTMAAVRTHLYDHLMTLSIGFFEERRVGEIISRSTNDVDQLQDMLSGTLPDFARQLVAIIFGIAFTFAASARLTLLAIAIVPALVVATFFYGRFIRRLARERQDALAATSVITEETLQNIHTVKGFSNEEYESRRYRTSLDKVVRLGIKGAVYRGGFATLLSSGLFGSFAVVLWYGVTLIKSGDLTSGVLVSFMLYVGFIGGAVAQFGDLFGRLSRSIGSSERLFEIMEEPGEFAALDTTEPVRDPIHGAITLDHLHFAYPTRKDIEVLKGISFDVQPGQKIALAGQSGAGKSTIAQLILGFYKPVSGTILFDGKPAKEFDLRALRRQMAVVPQEVLLFGGTIRENIAYGRPGASEEAIREAARQANALSFIDGFPDGMDTIVGDRGIKLSGGQRQRVAIARAILKDPVLLILDEATSALDSESEHLVQEALEGLMRNRTTLIIAHRLSTIRHVDCIFVLQEGRIVESGSFDALEGRPGGVFRQLLQLQFQKNLVERVEPGDVHPGDQ
ncbi:ABC transporter ATP-binding protein [Dinghuibacter silviterrae]|uniref:ABC-type multidrug transport system fused ATPase/permease subunit n=1 Tax=Dinghuibacter silviterrae TaxID=1539049 RepID=A0A4R8DEH1_9BACT|nr:ABC transporter ATP-binding protein [Dinghuibacter silviterrae]TDW95777.1 ABC-type multidrug transport system fused ATPase/permease subunit [Dinghuibacter silviterrae]